MHIFKKISSICRLYVNYNIQDMDIQDDNGYI